MSSTISTPGARLSRDDLHAYQRRMVDFIVSTPRCALFAEMGLGKTAATLTALSDLFDRCEIGRVLIIAPVRVARHVWPAECRRWEHLRYLEPVLLAGSPHERQRLLADRSPLHVIGKELVPWLVETLGKTWPYDTVVIDESSAFKSASTKRFRALRKVLPTTDRMIELTGTPAPNGLLDLWSQMFLLDGGQRLGRTITKYKMVYFEPDYTGYHWTPRRDTAETVHALLQDICMTMTTADYLELPPRLDNRVAVSLPDAARRQYREMERHFLVELEDDTITAANAAAKAGKLLQMANGALYREDGESWAPIHDAKLDALADILDAADGPVFVAYNYRSDVARIRQRFPQAQRLDDSPDMVERWNAGGVPLLLAHPASAGHGLNLQDGGRLIVWYGLNWSLELYQQFNARLHRQGQSRPVIVHHIVAADTIDETVLAALDGKNATQTALLAALKRDIGARG